MLYNIDSYNPWMRDVFPFIHIIFNPFHFLDEVYLCVFYPFDAIVSRIVFLHSLIIFYVYIEKQGSCLLILYPTA